MDALPYLLADVGGTNTRVALGRDGAVDATTIRRFPNRDYPSLDAVLAAYVAERGVTLADAAVAVAGPVRDGRGELTNLAWSFDGAGLGRAVGVEHVMVLNDLQAQGHALGRIAAENIRTVIAGKPQPAGQTALVVGVGTGFNAAPVFETPSGRLVAPAECGHISLPVSDEADAALANHLRRYHGFASVEDALSGRGLEHLYAFAAGAPRPSAEVLAAVETDPHAARAVELFVTLLGDALGNFALTFLPFGGIYLIGGMARAVSPWFERYGLGREFAAKGRFEPFMAEFSVHVVEDDYAALAGLAAALSAR